MPTVTFNAQVSGDRLDRLPVDEQTVSNNELQILDTLFKKEKGTLERFLDGIRDILVVGLIFIIISLPQLNELIGKFFPTTLNSEYMLIFVKAIIFMVVYFVVKNFCLVRK
jgi:hypothetical protein